MSQFTLEDSQNLIRAAQAAPLQNLHAAAQLSAVLERAQEHFRAVFQSAKEPAPVEVDSEPSTDD